MAGRRRRPGFWLPAAREVTHNAASAPRLAMTSRARLQAYLQLIRPANVTTALADVLAGFAVAGLAPLSSLPWLLLSTACLYAGGIVLNDVFDRAVDAVERPERPIPSGRIAPGAAAALGAALLLAGVAGAALASPTAAAVAALTAGFVVLYDSWGKRQSLFGPVNMGLCRGLNLMLGVSAAPAALAWAWPLVFLPVTYTAAVTALSRGEVHGGSRGIAGFALISLTVVLIALAGLSLSARAWWAGLLLTAALGWRVLPSFWTAYRAPAPGPIRQAIRSGVLSLVWLDAVIGAVYGGPLYSLVILGTAFIAGRLARTFSVT
jgi:UbiA prenyltransferase family